MAIQDWRLPEGIEKGSKFTPTFQNVIQEAISGNEQRFAQWTKCRGVGDVSYGLLNSTDHAGDFAAIMAVYLACNGSLLPFRFKNWSDYSVTDENFGTGDGSTLTFQLTKTYDPSLILLGMAGSVLYVRDITLPAIAVPPVIKVDGVTKTVVTDYNIVNGACTFTSAPASMKPLTWTGQFDQAVRFDGTPDFIMNESDIVSIGSLPIREVIGET